MSEASSVITPRTTSGSGSRGRRSRGPKARSPWPLAGESSRHPTSPTEVLEKVPLLQDEEKRYGAQRMARGDALAVLPGPALRAFGFADPGPGGDGIPRAGWSWVQRKPPTRANPNVGAVGVFEIAGCYDLGRSGRASLSMCRGDPRRVPTWLFGAGSLSAQPSSPRAWR